MGPPIAANDLRYKFPDEQKRGQTEVALPQGNRYRLAATVLGSRLWVSSDFIQLEKIIDTYRVRTSDRSPIASEMGEIRADDKINLVLNLDRVISKGIITTDPKVLSFTKSTLMDFQAYSMARIAISVDRDASVVRFVATLPLREEAPE